MKVVADSRFGRLLGVHMVGPHAGEMLAEAVLALELEVTLDEFTSVIVLIPPCRRRWGRRVLRPRDAHWTSSPVGRPALGARVRCLRRRNVLMINCIC